jgi:hypothetical protein
LALRVDGLGQSLLKLRIGKVRFVVKHRLQRKIADRIALGYASSSLGVDAVTVHFPGAGCDK